MVISFKINPEEEKELLRYLEANPNHSKSSFIRSRLFPKRDRKKIEQLGLNTNELVICSKVRNRLSGIQDSYRKGVDITLELEDCIRTLDEHLAKA